MSSKIHNILNGHIDSSTFSEDLVCRAFISNYLGEKKLLDWETIIVKMVVLDVTSEGKNMLIFGINFQRT